MQTQQPSIGFDNPPQLYLVDAHLNRAMSLLQTAAHTFNKRPFTPGITTISGAFISVDDFFGEANKALLSLSSLALRAANQATDIQTQTTATDQLLAAA